MITPAADEEKRHIFCKTTGFTLAETLLASSVAVIVGMFLVGILVNNTGVFYKQNSMVSEGLSLNDTMTAISNQIKQGVGVAAGYPESSPTILSGANTLVLKLPALSSEGPISDVYDYVAVYPDSSNPNVLRIQTFPSTNPASTRPANDQVITSLLQSVQFTYLDRSGNTTTPDSAVSVGVSLTVLSKTGSVGSSHNANAVVVLRNH